MALILGALGAAGAQAQNATLRGFVTDADDGEPLQGVNVILTDGAGGLYGSATDADGLYAVSRVPAGTYALRATFIGYATEVDTLTLGAGEIRTYNIELRQEETGLDEVVVESEREGAGAAAVVAGLQAIRPQDIALIPAPDVSGDLVNYLVTLPGVVSVGDQGGQLFVRGGEPTQNLVLLDGMLVYQPFHLVGFYSSFPSNIIQVTDVYAGGFPARYGGRLSSVIDVQTRNGNKRRWEGEVSLAPFLSAARVEGPIFPGRASVLLSGRFSVIDQGAAQLIDDPLPYDFDDQFAKLHIDVSSNSQAAVTALRSYDRGIIGAQDGAVADSAQDAVVWRNQAIGARYLLLPTRLPVQAEILISTSQIENTFGPEDNPTRSSRAQQYNVSANVTHFLGRSDVDWGIYVRTNDLESALGGAFQGVEDEREFVTEAGAFIETELAFGEGLRVEPGLHLESFPSKGRSFVEPRLRVVYERGAHQLSAAGGVFHQQIIGLADRRDAGDVFTAWTSAPSGTVPEALHLIAGYQVRPFAGLRLAAEGFYKRLSNLSIAEWTAFPRFTTGLQPADGTVLGTDLRAEFSAGFFYGFLNYGYSEVEYEADASTIEFWFGTPSLVFSPPHDRRHQVNALGSLRAAGFELSVR